MRKKELIKFNNEMFSRLDSANINISNLEFALKKRDTTIEALNNEIIRLKTLLEDAEARAEEAIAYIEQINEQNNSSENLPMMDDCAKDEQETEETVAALADDNCESMDENIEAYDIVADICGQKEEEEIVIKDALADTPFKVEQIEKKPSSDVKKHVNDELDNEILSFASDIIGKIVVSAARQCNKLSLSGNKELINLILGRTEVAKSEILDITVCEADDEHKRLMITGVYEQALEYINSVAAQI